MSYLGRRAIVQEVERLYYLCSENKGADQLRGYREADLPLCFRICKKPVFSRHGSFNIATLQENKIKCHKEHASYMYSLINSQIFL